MSKYVGHKVSTKLDFETSFKGSSDSGNSGLPLGLGARITTYTSRQNINRQYNIGSRLTADYLPLRFEGEISIEMTLSEKYWFELILHNTGNPISVGTDIKSAKVYIIYPDGFYRLAEGVVVNRATLTARAGDPVSVRIDTIFATESKKSGAETGAESSQNPFTFAGGTVSFGTGSYDIQNIEFTVNNNAELLWALGDRAPMDAVLKQLEIDGRMSIYGDSSLSNLLDEYFISGDVNELTVTLEFLDVVGEASGGKKIVVELTGVVINEVPHSITANEVVMVDAVFYAKNITVTTYTHDGSSWNQD